MIILKEKKEEKMKHFVDRLCAIRVSDTVFVTSFSFSF